MIKRTMKLVITFHTTTDAMAMEQMCKQKGVAGRLIPVPRLISAGCGLAWCAGLESEIELKNLMKEQNITYQEFHQCLV